MDFNTIILVGGIGVLVVFLAAGAYLVTRPQPEVLGHPKGLCVLFFAEMWERFSYYGMRALLIFYLTEHWLFSDSKANLIYGAYGSLVYIAPVLGGYLADRWLGQRKAVLFGAIVLAGGHCLMAVEGSGGPNDPTISIFWLALSFIIVGSGFLKANISVIVGQLYPRTDTRRDSAYTIFYMGVNTGAAAGTIIAGWLGRNWGWSWGFGAAGVGMLLGLVVFVVFKPLLMGKGEPPRPQELARPIAGIKLEHWLYGVGILGIPIVWGLIQYQDAIGVLLMSFGAALLAYVLYEAFKLDAHARDRIFAIIFLILLQPIFWGLFEQAGGSLSLFTDRFVDRAGVDAELFQSINPIYIILFGPVFATLWAYLGRRGWEPSTPVKFGIALLQLGLGFLVLDWGSRVAGIGNLTPVIFIFLIYLLHTTGELCLSPVGLSAMNRLSPRHMASLIMAAWFLGSAGGNFVAGKIGEATGGESGAATKESILAIYAQIGWVAIAVAVGVMVVSPLIKRLMHLDTLRDDEALAGEAELGEPQAAGTALQGEVKA